MTVFSISTILALTAASETAVAAAATGLIANPAGSLGLSEDTLIAFAEAMNPSVPQTGGDVGPQSTTASGFQVGPGPSAGQGLGKVLPALWRPSRDGGSRSLAFGSASSIFATPTPAATTRTLFAAAADGSIGDGTTAGSPVAAVPNLSALTDLTGFTVDKILTAFGGVEAMNANEYNPPLNGKRLTGAQVQELYNGGLRNFRGADLRGANLEEADLRGANLDGAILAWAILRRADLRGAILEGAILARANLRGADLRVAILKEVIFYATQFDAQTRFPFFFWLRWVSFGRKYPGLVRVETALIQKD